MPAKKRPGLTGVYVELADEQVAALDALAASLPLGGKADHIRLAIRRHLESPPTVAVPDMPSAAIPSLEAAADKPAKKPAGKKK